MAGVFAALQPAHPEVVGDGARRLRRFNLSTSLLVGIFSVFPIQTPNRAAAEWRLVWLDKACFAWERGRPRPRVDVGLGHRYQRFMTRTRKGQTNFARTWASALHCDPASHRGLSSFRPTRRRSRAYVITQPSTWDSVTFASARSLTARHSPNARQQAVTHFGGICLVTAQFTMQE
jgi:hypothetical protein